MQHLEVSCAVRRFFKSLGFKGLIAEIIIISRKSGWLDFPLKIGYTGSLNFGCYYLQYVPSSETFDHAWFEVPEAITLCCTWSDNR